MAISKIPILKSNEKGVIYDCDKINFIHRKKGTINADHTHEEYEVLYLVMGEVELTIGDKTEIIKAPVKIEIPSNIYHKLIALSDIILLEEK